MLGADARNPSALLESEGKMKTKHVVVSCFLIGLILDASYAQESPSVKAVRGFTSTPPRTFSFEDLLSILADPRTDSIDVLVEKLPQAYRENYVEIFASRSPEKDGATPKAPRIVSYGDEAKLIIGYFGDPSHKISFNNLQICRFNDSLKTWEFYQTNVPALKTTKGELAPLEKNPAKCLVCHGRDDSPPSPIWDPYPLWPGVSGGEDEMLFHSPFWVGDNSKAFKLRSQFTTNKPTLPRYRLLREHEGTRSDGDNRSQPYSMDEPNTTFSHLLILRQTESMARALHGIPELKPYRYAILGAATGRFTYNTPYIGMAYRTPPKETKLTGVKQLVFDYPMFELVPPGLLVGPGNSESDYLEKVFDFDRKSESLRYERHLKLLDIKDPEYGSKERYINKKMPFGVLTKKQEILPRLMAIVDNLGGSIRAWSLDSDKLLAVEDGFGSFPIYLEYWLWTEYIDKVDDPELFKIFSQATKDFHSPAIPRNWGHEPILWGGRDLYDLDALNHEITTRAHVCDLLREKSRKELGLPLLPDDSKSLSPTNRTGPIPPPPHDYSKTIRKAKP